MKNTVFFDGTLCDSYKNRRFREPIASTLIMEVIRSFETYDFTRTTRRYIQEGGILHSYRRDNLKSYIALTGWTV
jgi:hypothetical protein